jgi:hypothetical protein
MSQNGNPARASEASSIEMRLIEALQNLGLCTGMPVLCFRAKLFRVALFSSVLGDSNVLKTIFVL